MAEIKPIHLDFLFLLELRDQSIIELFNDLRNFVLEIHPSANELVYHTHALSTVFSISDKPGDAFCMINIYSNHMNLGFNKGTLIKDPHQLLEGTGNLIRHISLNKLADYRYKKIKDLVKNAADFAIKDMEKPLKFSGQSFSKIKKK